MYIFIYMSQFVIKNILYTMANIVIVMKTISNKNNCIYVSETYKIELTYKY